RMSQPHASDPPPPWRRSSDGLAPRLIGAALLVGAASTGLEQHLAAWPAWLMLASGLYLVLRR
ncbi:TPA: ubiquinone biosynthesis regulatory protein kinase UbiB, partial [Pseudomonas aeruginosa]|nr:ubiquinone biosynthesis regulatory protein kinase UbiB [Pseudomonas aeruginosa]